MPVSRADARPDLADGLLVGTSTILAIVIGVCIGMIARAGTAAAAFDQVSTSVDAHALLDAGVVARPDPVRRVFAAGFGPMPRHLPDRRAALVGRRPGRPSTAWSTPAWHLALPVITLTLAYLAEYSLIMRSSLLDELGEDYLVTARAKGLRDVDVRRPARRAATPCCRRPPWSSLNLGFVVSGAITIETVFSIPGLGLLTTEALAIPDYPVLQGTFLVSSAAVIVANLVANLALRAPRPAGADMSDATAGRAR